jgi:hypothetical protein
MRKILGWIATSMLCSAVLVTAACSPPPPPPPPQPRDEWYTYRYDSMRTGAQPWASALSDPAKVGTLHVGCRFWQTQMAVSESGRSAAARFVQLFWPLRGSIQRDIREDRRSGRGYFRRPGP